MKRRDPLDGAATPEDWHQVTKADHEHLYVDPTTNEVRPSSQLQADIDAWSMVVITATKALGKVPPWHFRKRAYWREVRRQANDHFTRLQTLQRARSTASGASGG